MNYVGILNVSSVHIVDCRIWRCLYVLNALMCMSYEEIWACLWRGIAQLARCCAAPRSLITRRSMISCWIWDCVTILWPSCSQSFMTQHESPMHTYTYTYTYAMYSYKIDYVSCARDASNSHINQHSPPDSMSLKWRALEGLMLRWPKPCGAEAIIIPSRH